MFSQFDVQMMQRAIELAKRGIFTTTPNPNVGCVITKEDCIVGEGFHFRAGEPHAEVHALDNAKENSKGATAYVTLEPCSHVGRTPPCADALIAAGISRVVCAMVDPNPQVAGRGIARLREAGINVDIGLMQQQARELNPAFSKMMETGLPYVQLKLAASLDGRTALANGKSQWITGSDARADVQVFRAQAGAILSTAQTIIDDDPSLNVRWAQLPVAMQARYPQDKLRQPLRVILDTSARVPANARLFSVPGDILWLTAQSPFSPFPQPQVAEGTAQSTIEVMTVASSNAGLDLGAVLTVLANKGINHLWIEAGATLAAAFLAANLVDELIVYQSPMLLGADSRALVNMYGLTEIAQAPRFEFKEVVQLGSDVRFRMILLK